MVFSEIGEWVFVRTVVGVVCIPRRFGLGVLQRLIRCYRVSFVWCVSELECCGYTIRFVSWARGYMCLRLGYGHLTFVRMPAGVGVRIIKRRIFVFGINVCLVDRVVRQIKKLRPFNKYKLRGIKEKRLKLKLKPIKKSA